MIEQLLEYLELEQYDPEYYPFKAVNVGNREILLSLKAPVGMVIFDRFVQNVKSTLEAYGDFNVEDSYVMKDANGVAIDLNWLITCN